MKSLTLLSLIQTTLLFKKQDMETKIIQVLNRNPRKGLTITELVKESKLSRSAIRTILSRLEGADKVQVRKIGMAKVYSLKGEKN